MKKPGEHKNRIQFGKKGRNRAKVWFAPGAGTLGSEAREMLKAVTVTRCHRNS